MTFECHRQTALQSIAVRRLSKGGLWHQWVHVALIGLGPLGLAACQVVGGYEDFDGIGYATSSGSQTTGGTCGSMPGTPDRGPSMRSVVGAAGCAWIDATEVSRGQYQAFLDSNPNVTNQGPACVTWNKAFEPDPGCLGDTSYVIATSDAHPQVCVDQCDAQAFCQWAGKTLCKASFQEPTLAKADVWYSACSKGASQQYPYGTTYQSQACNGLDKSENGCPSACTTFPVGSLTTCASGDGVSDLVGNVAEWSEACDGTNGATDHCLVRGGWFATQGPRCDAEGSFKRTDVFPYVGFRCCAS